LAAKIFVFVDEFSNALSLVKLIAADDLDFVCKGVKLTVATRNFPLNGAVLPLAMRISPFPPVFSAVTPKALFVVSMFTKFSLSIGYDKLACTAFTCVVEESAHIWTDKVLPAATLWLDGVKDKFGVTSCLAGFAAKEVYAERVVTIANAKTKNNPAKMFRCW
jgi:hypothetical protein